MTVLRSPQSFRGRPALAGWASAAMAVTGSLSVAACTFAGAGDTEFASSNVAPDAAQGLGADAIASTVFGAGLCAVRVDAGDLDDRDASSDSPRDTLTFAGVCPVEVDAGTGDNSDSALVAPDSFRFVAGICVEQTGPPGSDTLDASSDSPDVGTRAFDTAGGVCQ